MNANNKLRAAMKEIARITNTAKSDFDIFAGFERILKISNSALSAPPRNCDKCLTLKDAMLAHLAEVYEGEKVEFGDYEWCKFVKWLFAEAKGENK